jgi:hypothetical protein
MRYMGVDVRDDQSGAAAINKFKGQVRKSYLINLKRKDQVHHGTAEGARGPLEAICRQLNFKLFVFGTFGEMSSNVGKLVEKAVEYGVEHLGRNMAATTVETVMVTLMRRYKAQLPMAAWMGYANLLLDGTKYDGRGTQGANMAHTSPTDNEGSGGCG